MPALLPPKPIVGTAKRNSGIPKGVIMPNSLKRAQETSLVVDDNEGVRGAVVRILEANFRVFSAKSGPAALKLAGYSNVTLDLLLSDVDMPEMSGQTWEKH
jgi:response regulator RpfG family c-di-GMP phosphodiesterase